MRIIASADVYLLVEGHEHAYALCTRARACCACKWGAWSSSSSLRACLGVSCVCCCTIHHQQVATNSTTLRARARTRTRAKRLRKHKAARNELGSGKSHVARLFVCVQVCVCVCSDVFLSRMRLVLRPTCCLCAQPQMTRCKCDFLQTRRHDVCCVEVFCFFFFFLLSLRHSDS